MINKYSTASYSLEIYLWQLWPKGSILTYLYRALFPDHPVLFTDICGFFALPHRDILFDSSTADISFKFVTHMNDSKKTEA